MNTNIDSVNNGRLKPSNKRNPCPVCNGNSGHCKYNPLKSLFLCHNFDVDVPGYKFIKKTKDSHWSIFVPESDFKGVPDSAILAEREERRLEREWLRKQQQALSLSDTDRHIEYTKLKDQLYLTVRDKTDLLKRGLTDEQIKKEGFVSVKQFQKLREYINPNLAGVNVAGKGLTNSCEGLLCFTKNPTGEITGYQIRNADKTVSNKYVWASSKANNNRNVGATVHLKETGELPLTCEFENPEDRMLRLCEGILKPKIAAILRNQNFIGASGGNFAASFETFKSYIEQFNPNKTIIICPDKNTLYNSQVLNQWRKTRDFLDGLGFSVYVEIWEDSDKYDVDEYPVGNITELIPYTDWDTDYKNIADIESPQKEQLKNWNDSRKFTPNVIINQQYLTDSSLNLPWNDDDTYFIKSPLGTGKTTWLVNELKKQPRRFFAWGKINNLLLQFVTKAPNCNHFQEHDGRLLILDKNTNLAYCINSLVHFEPEIFDGTIIIIDETVSVVKQLYSLFLGAKQSKIIEMFEEGIRRAAVVVCLDGTLTDDVVNFITKLREKPDSVYKILNTHKPKPFNIKFLQVTDAKSGKLLSREVSGVLKRILTHNKPVFVTVTSQKKAELLDRMATKRDKKVFRLDSKTSPEEYAKNFLANPNDWIETEKPDLVIISPSGGEGLDISITGYFEAHYHIGNCLDADTNFQMISRLRDASVPRYLHVPYEGFSFDEISNESLDDLQIRLFLNLRRDIEAVSSEEYQAKLREAIDNYTANSIHFDMSSKLKWKSDFEVKNLRDCLMIMLKEAGHKISFEEVTNDKVIKTEAKEIKEEIIQEEITGIFNAEDITDTKGKKWDNNSQGLTKEERYQHKKWKYKQLLPGLASTSHWTIELIELLVKKPETISQLTLRYYFNNPDKVKQLKEFKLLKRLEYERIIFLKTAPSDYQKIEFLKKSGIEFLITDNSDFYCADTDWVTIVCGYLKSKASTAERLGFSCNGNDKVKTVNNILKKMGHRVERTQTHMDGKRVIGYRILPLDDLGQAMMDAIGRRIDERIEKAVQSQSEDKPIDYAKFRQDDEPLSESSRDFEPDALLTTGFFINKTETSASANPPIGTWIELDLPTDFYFTNSLVFDKVNGKRWEIEEYVSIRGEDWAYLGNDSGEKSSIPCSWLAYCCDCIG